MLRKFQVSQIKLELLTKLMLTPVLLTRYHTYLDVLHFSFISFICLGIPAISHCSVVCIYTIEIKCPSFNSPHLSYTKFLLYWICIVNYHTFIDIHMMDGKFFSVCYQNIKLDQFQKQCIPFTKLKQAPRDENFGLFCDRSQLCTLLLKQLMQTLFEQMKRIISMNSLYE